MNDPSDIQNGQRGWNATYVVLAFVAMLIIYALSIGPVIVIIQAIPEPFLSNNSEGITYVYLCVYYPLILLMQNSTIVESFYGVYFQILGI